MLYNNALSVKTRILVFNIDFYIIMQQSIASFFQFMIPVSFVKRREIE